MAHGNLSDLVFLALIGIVVQWFAFPATLYEDIGPLKAQLSTKGADMDALLKFGGGLMLFIGTVFSAVKWNPMNGKMPGLAAFFVAGHTGYNAFKADAQEFAPRFFYVYAFVLLIGAFHICVAPSNPLPKKTPQTKNNHGNFSDSIATGLFLVSLSWYFYPEHLFQDFGPVKAQFVGSTKSADLMSMIQFVAGLILIVAMMFSAIKWDPINGKLSGIGGFAAAGYTAYSTFEADGQKFVPRLFYFYAAFVFFGTLHIFAFPSNPAPAKPDAKKE
jgi:hypothetical protein